MKDIAFFITVITGLLIIFYTARRFSRKKIRPKSDVIDKYGKRWHYLRKTTKGYLFRNPEGKMETLTNTNIFKGVKF